MTISEIQEGENIILAVSGHIDTVTAPDLQKQLLKSFQKSSNIILDLTQVDYISSSGIRAVLIGQKTAGTKNGSFIIRGANEDVKKIFAIVNLDKMLHFED